MTVGRLRRRGLHPLAWWLWALALATAASRTTNPLLLLLVFAVLGVTVANRRSDAPWARAFRYYLYLAAAVLVIRVVLRAVFGGTVDAAHLHVLVRLPGVALPRWAAGVQIGGPVTLEGTLGSVYDGLQLGCLLACVGAANSLANPKRVLRLLPGALYELGAAVVVALSVAPQLIESVQRVRRARRLRGDAATGRDVLHTVALPVLEDALERSLQLAASMDSRGYGRTGSAPAAGRRLTALLTLGGMAGLCIGVYGLLDGSAFGAAAVPTLVAGIVLCFGGLHLGGRRVRRTRYRPDGWGLPEWLVVAAGAVPALVLIGGIGRAGGGLNPSVAPPQWPPLPVLPVLAILVAAAAIAAAPAPGRAPAAPTRDPAPLPTTSLAPGAAAPGRTGTIR